jgi:hypothetical protein
LLPSPAALQTCGVNWESATGEQFEQALAEYREREYLGRSRVSGENAYLENATAWLIERVANGEGGDAVFALNRAQRALIFDLDGTLVDKVGHR